MNPIKKYILSLPFILNIILVVSIFSIVLIEFYLMNITEMISWGNEFGKIYYKLCLSIIASYIFYFIVIHLKSIKDKENINIFLEKKVSLIIGEYKRQIKEIKKGSQISKELEEFPTLQDIENMFVNIHPKSKAPLVLGSLDNYANWMQYFSYHNKRTTEHIKKIFAHMHFLDSELVKILAHIDDCSHFSVIDLLSSISFGNKDLKNFANDFHEYGKLCKGLEEYYNKKLKYFKE